MPHCITILQPITYTDGQLDYLIVPLKNSAVTMENSAHISLYADLFSEIYLALAV